MVTSALGRFMRIKWYIAGSGFEDCKESHGEFGGSLHAYRDGTAGAGTAGLQLSRDCVAAFMQLSISEALGFRSDRQSIWRLFNPLHHQLMHACIGGIGSRGIVQSPVKLLGID